LELETGDFDDAYKQNTYFKFVEKTPPKKKRGRPAKAKAGNVLHLQY